MNRRDSLSLLGGTLSWSCLNSLVQAAPTPDNDNAGPSHRHISTNMYPWLTFARRAGEAFEPHTNALLSAIAKTGIAGYEPVIDSVSELDGLGDRLKKHGLEMRSLYVNSVLHDESRAAQSAADVVAIADAARALGTKIVVTNPSPIRWGGPEDKTDAQLRTQAKALDKLGAAMGELGLTLAYHNHDAELRQGGREFHHMLTSTDPANVKFCLDAHWIFRGCGNSEVAVFDSLVHYHDRIVELHLRQSIDGFWNEVFAMKGDIDYSRLFTFLGEHKKLPHLVLEQAVEENSPNELSVVEAHTKSRANLAAAE